MSLRTENELLKEESRRNSRIFLTVFLVMATLLFVASYSWLWGFLQPKGRVSCASVSSYADACVALDRGAYQLDGDHDRKPCESRFPAESARACLPL